ncbi:MAG: PAS domain S-box protein [Dehalococcoidales bacterium]|jgi:PAS domain S-box-containing protein
MLNDVIFLFDETGLINSNREAEKMFGVSFDDLLHKIPYQFAPDKQPDGADSKEKARELIQAAYAGQSQLFEWQVRKPDGTLFDAEVSLNAVDVEGKPVLLAVIRDITERKKEDEARLETEQMFRAIVENSHAGIFTIDETFNITYANDMVSRMLLYPNEAIIGRNFRDFLDEESKIIVAERYLQRQMGEDTPTRYEFNIVQSNGSKRRVEISATIFRTAAGHLRTVGQVLDITERKQAEEDLRTAHEELESRVQQRTSELSDTNLRLKNEIAQRALAEESLRRSELRYRHLVQSTNTIILQMDNEGKITFFNDFAQQFFGYTESEILGKSVLGTIVPEKDSADKDLQEMMADIITHPRHYLHNENENMRRGGERVWIVWTNQPFFDDAGNLREILCVGIDHTEQKLNEARQTQQVRRQAATEERTRLARDLHDAVSQTLFSASLISEVLPRVWQRDEKEGQKRLEEVRQLTRSALTEMRTLLLELRPDSLAEADIDFLLNQLAESITGRSRVPVSVSVTGRCNVPVEVKIGLYRIAQEALNNIAKHAAAKEARVKLLCRTGGVTLQVSDDGKGFNTKNTPPNSLGLNIMRERARDIGALLAVKSRPGEGTTVRAVWKNESGE